MINFRTETEFRERIISRSTVILSPNGLHEGTVVVASAENTKRLAHVVLMLSDRHALWLNLQPALLNVSCYLDSWPLPPCWFNVAQASILLVQLQVNIVLLDQLNNITLPQFIHLAYHMRVALTIWALRIIKMIHEGLARRILVACDLNTTNHLVLYSNATILATPYTSL